MPDSTVVSPVTGVSFDGVHSYLEWGLKLKKVSIGMPSAKTEYIDVPGMNGSLDLTEQQNGGVKYGMRTLEFVFDSRNCNYLKWTNLISRIAGTIQGRERRIILDMDSGFYYVGRCAIDTKKTDEVLAEITIKCTCEPYKIDVLSSDEPWKWDTFSFIDGVIRSTSDIQIDSSTSPGGWQKVVLNGWMYNDVMRIVSNASMTVRYRNYTYSVYSGDNYMYDIELYEGENELYFQGKGTITIVHRGGMI